MPYIDSYKFGVVWAGRSLFWVGGNDTWNSTAGTKWSLTSGGVGGEPVPTSIDDVYFDSGSGNVTAKISNASICRNAIFTGWPFLPLPSTDFIGTLDHSTGSWSIYGSLIFSTFMTYTPPTVSLLNSIEFVSNATGNIITSAGIRASSWTFDGVGGSWLLTDAISPQLGSTITLTNGTLNTNGVQVGTFLTTANLGVFDGVKFSSSGTGIRSLVLGTTRWILGSGGTLTWDISDPTNMTLDAGSSTIEPNTSSTGYTFNGGGLAYGSLIWLPLTGTTAVTITGNNSFADLTLPQDATSGSQGQYLLGADQTTTRLTLNGAGMTNRAFIRSTVRGVQRTITAASVVASYVTLQDIIGAGASAWDLSAITGNSSDCGNNSNITFTAPANQFWVPSGTSSGNWFIETRWANISGGVAGTGRIPLAQDTAKIDVNSIDSVGRTITVNLAAQIGAVDFTGATNNPTISFNAGVSLYGSMTLIAGMTYANVATIKLEGRGSQIFTTAGQTITTPITVDAAGGSWTVSGALTGDTFFSFNQASGTFVTDAAALMNCVNDWTQTGGTFTDGGGGVTAATFTSATGTGKTVNMAGVWTATGTISSLGTSLWNFVSAGLTLNAGTSSIHCTNTSGSAKTFEGGGLIYNDLSVSGALGAGTFTITGSNTFHNPTFAAKSNIKLTAATTQTITGAVTATGTAGNLVAIASTSGVNATISSAGNESWDYTILTHLTGTGGGTFTATNSTDGGGNVGITITP